MGQKGEYPPYLNGDGSLKEEVQERRKWDAFWVSIPGWLRTAIIALTVGSGASFGTLQMKQTATTQTDLRKVIREEMAPLNAGFKAFVTTQPPKVQLQILQAMTRATDKIKEAQ